MPRLVAGAALLASFLAAATLAEELSRSEDPEADACEDDEDDEDERMQLLQLHDPHSRQLLQNESESESCSDQKVPGESCVDGCNWCCSGWSAQTTMCIDPPACTEHGKPDYSGTYCGKTSHGTTDLACTPFDFKPFLNAQPKYCDGKGGFPAAADSFDASVKNQHRVWRAPNENLGYWVFHACDGAGIQGSDCNGDTYYAEYIYNIKPDSEKEPWNDCDMGTNVCNDLLPDGSEQTPECRHNKCSHYHSGLNQWHDYKCGWWNQGTIQGISGWYEASGWGDTKFWDELDTKFYDYGFIQLFDWVCHAQASDSDVENPCYDENQNIIDCGQDPDFNNVQYYSAFPLGNINQVFGGDKSMRCFCDNEAYGYNGGEKQEPPPGGRLFALWWKKDDFQNTLMIQQVIGDEIIPGTTNYKWKDGVALTPSEPNPEPASR